MAHQAAEPCFAAAEDALAGAAGIPECPCGGGEPGPGWIELRHRGTAYRVRPCGRCGRGILHPRPTQDQLLHAYDTAYYGIGMRKFVAPVEAGVEWCRRLRARAVVRRPARTRGDRPPRVLDIGCGGGRFLAHLAASGWECHGTELTARTAVRAAEYPGIRLRTGPLTPEAYPAGYFDVISLWHVLEHLPDPDRTLRDCRRWLAADGVLTLAVPNADSWQARLFGGDWFHLDPPFHLFHFGPRSLETCLEANGFRATEVRHLCWQYNPYGYLQSLLNRLGFPRDELYEMLKGNRFHPLPRLLVQALLAAAALPAAAAAALIEASFGHGGTIEVVARPAG